MARAAWLRTALALLAACLAVATLGVQATTPNGGDAFVMAELVDSVRSIDFDSAEARVFAEAQDRALIQHAAEASAQADTETEAEAETESEAEAGVYTAANGQTYTASEVASLSESELRALGIFDKLLKKGFDAVKTKVNTAVQQKLPGLLDQAQAKGEQLLGRLGSKVQAKTASLTSRLTSKLASSQFGQTKLGRLVANAAKKGADKLNQAMPGLLNKANEKLKALAEKAKASLLKRVNGTLTKVEDRIDNKLTPAQGNSTTGTPTPAKPTPGAGATKPSKRPPRTPEQKAAAKARRAAKKRALAKRGRAILKAKKTAERRAKKAARAAHKKSVRAALKQKAQESRKARIDAWKKAKNARQNLPNFGARVPLPIPEPVPRRLPAKLKEGEKSVSPCTNEGRRRINMCINLLGAMALPNDQQQVKFDEADVLGSCSDPQRSKLRSTSDIQICRKMRDHLFEVADLRQLHQAMRNEDPHNICVKVLATEVNGQVWLANTDATQCHQSHLTERQNEGVTGARCLFFHGSGVARLRYDEQNSQKGDYDGFLVSFPQYWQGVEAQVGNACDKRFFVTDTISRGWDDGSLQEEFCKAIRLYQPHVIFAHSTANNVLAAAIANRVKGCEVIAKAGQPVTHGQALWFGMNAAFEGTPLADVLRQECAKVDGPTRSWYNGVCAAQHAAPYHGIDALRTTHVNKAAISLSSDEQYGRAQLSCSLDGLVNHFEADEAIRRDCVSLESVAAQYQSGSLCGIAPDPFSRLPRRVHARSKNNFLRDPSIEIEWGKDGVTKASSQVVTGNDGFVPFESCRVPNRVYGFSPSSAFYATTTSHDDGRCANGEGANSKQQPCSWITQRLNDGLAAFAKLQEFRDAHQVASAPRATPLAPSFAGFRYDSHAIKERVQEELASLDAKAVKALPVMARASSAPRVRRAPKPVQPKQLWEKIVEQEAEKNKEQMKKALADAKIAEAANLKAYEAAMA